MLGFVLVLATIAFLAHDWSPGTPWPPGSWGPWRPAGTCGGMTEGEPPTVENVPNRGLSLTLAFWSVFCSHSVSCGLLCSSSFFCTSALASSKVGLVRELTLMRWKPKVVCTGAPTAPTGWANAAWRNSGTSWASRAKQPRSPPTCRGAGILRLDLGDLGEVLALRQPPRQLVGRGLGGHEDVRDARLLEIGGVGVVVRPGLGLLVDRPLQRLLKRLDFGVPTDEDVLVGLRERRENTRSSSRRAITARRAAAICASLIFSLRCSMP